MEWKRGGEQIKRRRRQTRQKGERERWEGERERLERGTRETAGGGAKIEWGREKRRK